MTENRFHNWVLAGIDGSERSLVAVRWAAQEAARRQVGLRIVSVSLWTDGRNYEFGEGATSAPLEEQQLLKELDCAADVAHEAEPDLLVDRAILSGFAPDRLRLESARVGMIVLGDRGIGGLRGMCLGSVAGSVAARAQCPVAIVRGPARAPDDGAPVLVGVDGSPASEAAIGFAFAAADVRRAPLTAVHAWDDRLRDATPFPMLNLEAVQIDEEELLAKRLDGWSHRYPGVAVERVVRRGKAAEVLREQAKRARLLVVGTHGRGPVIGGLLGSVSQSLLHRSDCPVVVVPPTCQASASPTP